MAVNAPHHFPSEMHLCELCNIKFTMKYHLQKHCETHHSGNNEWTPRMFRIHRKSHLTCTECDVSFEDEKKLEAHQQTHTGSNQYACEECNAMFVTEDGLESHADLHKLTRFACSRCDLDFSLGSTLMLHCIRRHSAPDNHSNDHGGDSNIASHPSETIRPESRCGNGYEVQFSIRSSQGSQVAAQVPT